MADGELEAFLSGTSFFGGLDAAIVARLAAAMTERRLGAGEILFEEGDTGNSMFIVRSGELIVERKSESGEPARLLMMRPGDFVGVTTLIEMEPRPFSCRAERDTLLHELTARDLYRLYKEDQKAYLLVLQNINRELCRRLRKAGKRIAALEELVRARPEHEGGQQH